MAKDTKNINIEVSHEVWKRLKIISITRDMTLQDVVRDILDKHVKGKSKQLEVSEEV